MNPDGSADDSSIDDSNIDKPGTGGPEDLRGSTDHADGSAVFDVFEGLVLDEAFVLAALIHEPSAEERLLALRAGVRRRGRASLSGSGAQPARTGSTRQAGGYRSDSFDGRRGRHQAAPGRWQRVVARVMLVVIGVLAILVAVAAVYRSAAPGHQPLQRPSTGSGGGSTASAAAVSGQVGSVRGSVQTGSVQAGR